MADKSKGVNGNHASDKTPTKQSKLWQLLVLAKEVSKDVDSIQDYEKSVEGRKALEQELEAKQGENKRLREVNDKVVREFTDHKAQASAKTETLFAEFEQKYKTYESNKEAVEAMKKEVAEMRQKLAASEARDDEVDKLKQRLHSAEAHGKNHAAEIREMNAECELQRSQMQKTAEELSLYKTKLGQAQSDLGEAILKDYSSAELKKLGLDLQALLGKIHTFVTKDYFHDHDGAADSGGEIQELNSRFPNIPLSARVTDAAARMRCAVAEAIIAETLRLHVFVPFYVPSDVKVAASAMLNFFEGDEERRQTVYRCQILGSMSDFEQAEKIQDEIVRKASSEIRNTLFPLVKEDKRPGFLAAVPGLLRQAVQLWADVQRSRDLIVAETPDDDRAGQHDYYNYATGHKTLKGKPSTLAVFFPRVVCRDEVVFEGVVLKSNQGAVIEAQEQLHHNGTNGDSKKRVGNRRRASAEPDAPVRTR
ncbi:hypothetical protein FDECE_16899 [Fusarium decemcellulare]|nr:hypothetical protein FDECE_16899 [Fusarium decemcellulare]